MGVLNGQAQLGAAMAASQAAQMHARRITYRAGCTIVSLFSTSHIDNTAVCARHGVLRQSLLLAGQHHL